MQVGDKFPSFKLQLSDGSAFDTGNLAQKTVFFFYPKDDTPGCTTENKDFSALAAEFARAGTMLVGISKDPPARHLKFIAKHGLSVPLASDAEQGGLSDALGFWGEKRNYGRSYMGMIRSTVLVGADGVIARVWSPVKVKGHAEEVLAAARGL